MGSLGGTTLGTSKDWWIGGLVDWWIGGLVDWWSDNAGKAHK
jgi:hypothetical protein